MSQCPVRPEPEEGSHVTDQRRYDAIEGLFEAMLVSKPRAERISRFVTRTRDVPADRLLAACRQLELGSQKAPTIADIRGAAQGLRRVADDAGEDERRVLEYHLARYSDADYWAFRDRFGVEPVRELFARYAIMPHEDVTFARPSRQEAGQLRADAARLSRDAFDRARLQLVEGAER